jgi:hypothetical protein
MFPRQFIVLISAFVTFISSFDLLFAFPPPQPKISVVNLYQVTPKIGSSKTPVYRQSLQYTDAQGRSRTIHAVSETEAVWYKTYLHPILSPQGNYIATNYSTYEGVVRPSIFRVSDKRDLLINADLNFDVRSGLIWSPDERFFVINSFHEDFGGTGRPGLFISYFPFSQIKPIMEFSPAQAQAGTKISGVEISGNKVYFTLVTIDPDCSISRPPYSCPTLPPKMYSFTP